MQKPTTPTLDELAAGCFARCRAAPRASFAAVFAWKSSIISFCAASGSPIFAPFPW